MKHSDVSQTRQDTPTPPLLLSTCPIPVASVLLRQRCVAGATSARANAATRICPSACLLSSTYESPSVPARHASQSLSQSLNPALGA